MAATLKLSSLTTAQPKQPPAPLSSAVLLPSPPSPNVPPTPPLPPPPTDGTTNERRRNRWGDGLDGPAAGARDFFPAGWTPARDVRTAIKVFGHSESALDQLDEVGQAGTISCISTPIQGVCAYLVMLVYEHKLAGVGQAGIPRALMS